MLRTSQLPLATRLSIFFLAMIGLVLIAFSVVFYWFTSDYLRQQVEVHATSTINALAAAAEITAQGVEWESNGRILNFKTSAISEEAVWAVIDRSGNAVDQSADLRSHPFQDTLRTLPLPPNEDDDVRIREYSRWLIAERWISSNSKSHAPPEFPGDPDDEFHVALLLRVAVLLEHSRVLRTRVALTLTLLSVGIWLGACVAARSLCLRALLPLQQMTEATQQINIDHLAERLPELQTRDELAELTTAFNALLDRLQDSFLRQQRFTGDASHQLRTPLAAMLGQVEVALRRERSPDEYHRILSIVLDRTTHLKNIVDALLFLARADGDAAVPEHQNIEIRTFIQTFYTSCSEHARFSGLRVEFLDAESCVVSGHPVLLHELLTILVDNSFKFSQPGTPVVIQTRSDADFMIVSVIDSGNGIAPEDLSCLGVPFFRSENARRLGIDGVGLGLSIAMRLAATLGGSISFASEIGRGSVATLRLPRK